MFFILTFTIYKDIMIQLTAGGDVTLLKSILSQSKKKIVLNS
jgi:hypothetical protein